MYELEMSRSRSMGSTFSGKPRANWNGALPGWAARLKNGTLRRARENASE
jgi:hypothetical protein